MVAIYDKLRPTTLDEIVGFKKQIKILKTLRESVGWKGQCFWIAGGSGHGKTTIARIIASSVASDWTISEMDAQDVGIDLVRQWEKECSQPVLGGGGYAYIVNEAHGLSNKVVSRLQTTLETPGVQARGTFIFTTTYRGQQLLLDERFDSGPFMSRAIQINWEIDSDTVKEMAMYLQTTARAMEMDGQPLGAYIELLDECSCNLRLALQKIVSGSMLEK